ncbi:MAG: methyltransferase domain-containing protein [Cellvibrionaceae bacterium]|nr:methyltransferase domain-containing protein [Cellvibrionaceae bacterium]
MSVGSYIASDFSQDISDEIRRLGVQVELFWQEEKKVYDNLAIPEQARILEIGSGPGFYVKKLAELFPQARFVSLEYDKTFSAYQHQLFAGELAERTDIVCGDILNIEGLGEFDLVVSRMVLEHLPQPQTVFQKMNAFVKRGGTFVLLDNDFSNHLRTYPRVSELDELYEAYCQQRIAEGGNPYIGRELPHYFSMAGYDDIQFHTVSAHTYKVDKSLFLGAESSAIGMTLVKNGHLDAAIFNKLILNWSKMAHDPNNVMIRELYCAYGTKTERVADFAAKQGSVAITKLAEKKPVAVIDALSAIPPQTETERHLAAIWREFLRLETLDTQSSFFDLGGESYLIPLVVDAMDTRYQLRVEITDFFEYPTIKSLAAFIDGGSGGEQLEQAASSAVKQKRAVAKSSGSNPFARLKKK